MHIKWQVAQQQPITAVQEITSWEKSNNLPSLSTCPNKQQNKKHLLPKTGSALRK